MCVPLPRLPEALSKLLIRDTLTSGIKNMKETKPRGASNDTLLGFVICKFSVAQKNITGLVLAAFGEPAEVTRHAAFLETDGLVAFRAFFSEKARVMRTCRLSVSVFHVTFL